MAGKLKFAKLLPTSLPNCMPQHKTTPLLFADPHYKAPTSSRHGKYRVAIRYSFHEAPRPIVNSDHLTAISRSPLYQTLSLLF